MGIIEVPISGMHCKSCEILVEGELKKIPGTKKISVNYREGLATVAFKGAHPSRKQLEEAIQAAGYEIGEKEKLGWFSRRPWDYIYLMLAAWILFGLFLGHNRQR
jgi:copper chaperone CopZ